MITVIVAFLALVVGFIAGLFFGRDKSKEPEIKPTASMQFPILNLDLSQDVIIRDALGGKWTLVAAGSHGCQVVSEEERRRYVFSYRDHAGTISRQDFMTLFPEFAYLYQSKSETVTISREEYESLKPLATAYKQAVQELEKL